mmetsp:Transcript_3038/g.8233  ORF Transcript_3038/g.8233 Transcript_3038/m.8233 type:complete len:229 (+) Transcript_3038:926-1612(+)
MPDKMFRFAVGHRQPQGALLPRTGPDEHEQAPPRRPELVHGLEACKEHGEHDQGGGVADPRQGQVRIPQQDRGREGGSEGGTPAEAQVSAQGGRQQKDKRQRLVPAGHLGAARGAGEGHQPPRGRLQVGRAQVPGGRRPQLVHLPAHAGGVSRAGGDSLRNLLREPSSSGASQESGRVRPGDETSDEGERRPEKHRAEKRCGVLLGRQPVGLVLRHVDRPADGGPLGD